MLVVICAIRKMVECIFSKRELRLLDDLLPESNKQRRRASHKPGLRKFRKKDRDIEEIDDKPTTTRRSRSRNSKGGRKEKNKDSHHDHSRKAITLEPRSRSPSLPPYPKVDRPKHISSKKMKDTTDSTMSMHSKKNTKTKRENRRKLNQDYDEQSLQQQSFKGNTSQRGPSPKKTHKCCIYVKLDRHEIFTSIHLERKTVSTLLQCLEAKFGIKDFDASSIDKTYQMNKKKFVFHLDDDMMEYVQPHEVFNIQLVEVDETEEGGIDHATKYNMTMIEMD